MIQTIAGNHARGLLVVPGAGHVVHDECPGLLSELHALPAAAAAP